MFVQNFGSRILALKFEPTNLSNVENAVYASDFVPCLPASEMSLLNVGNLIHKFIVNLSGEFFI